MYGTTDPCCKELCTYTALHITELYMIWTSLISADIKRTILTNIIKDKFYTEYRSSTHWHKKIHICQCTISVRTPRQITQPFVQPVFCMLTLCIIQIVKSFLFGALFEFYWVWIFRPYRLGAIPSTQLTTFSVALQVRNSETVVGRSSRRVFLIGTLHIELPVGSCLLFEHKTIQIQLKTETSRDDVTQN